jgi:hypothetical protein
MGSGTVPSQRGGRRFSEQLEKDLGEDASWLKQSIDDKKSLYISQNARRQSCWTAGLHAFAKYDPTV